MRVCNNPGCGHQNHDEAECCVRCGKPLLRAEQEILPPSDEGELPIETFKGTSEEIERQWFEKVYRPRGANMLQLTWRAVIMGSLLGGILSLTNIYIGLKSGWALGVSITACILSFAIWNTLFRTGIAKTPMTILENNSMQSTATAAGVSSGGTLVSAFSAFILINGHGLPLPLMLAWVFFLAVLGVTMAIPMKRQMINVEQLRFPSGIATAETLRALHSHGDKGLRAARALGISGVLAAISAFWSDGLGLLSSRLKDSSLSALIDNLNVRLLGETWVGRTVAFTWDPVFMAAGALSGLRVSVSMFLGGTLCWAVYVPILQSRGIITGSGYKDIVQWTLWGGVACMVTSGLASFLLQWRSIGRAFKSVKKMFSPSSKAADEMEAIETPTSWFVIGQLGSLLALGYLAHLSFGMPWWQSAFAVFMSFFLAMVACRVTGETDTTPVGAMGKVTQMMFGVLSPGNMNVNLMSANITAGAAGASADLLTDLKSGYLLGANPRKQFLAQFAGIFIGTLVSVTCFSIMVPDAAALGTEQFPAPAAQTWRAVALALSKGLEALEPIKVWSMLVGGLVGIILPLLSKFLPKYDKYIPSAAAIGLAWTFQWYTAYLFFIGAVLGWIFEKAAPEKSKEFTFPVASGLIAGGSLMGVLIVFIENGPKMWQQLLGH